MTVGVIAIVVVVNLNGRRTKPTTIKAVATGFNDDTNAQDGAPAMSTVFHKTRCNACMPMT